VRLTRTANNSPSDTTKTPTEAKDSICPSLIACIRNGRDAPTSNAYGPRKYALHQANGDCLLQGRRGTKKSASERAPKERNTEDESLAVFLRDGGPEEGREELGEEEGRDKETGGKADVGFWGKLIESFNHKDKERCGDVGGEEFAEEDDG
jgi:hypothetical protein